MIKSTRMQRMAVSLIVLLLLSLSIPALAAKTSLKALGNLSTTAGVRMRDGAGTNTKTLDIIPKNTQLVYYKVSEEKDGSWYYVQYESQYGWMSGRYAKLIN